jgi:hypothetical protein
MSSIFVILLNIFYVMSTEVPPSHEMGSSDLMDDDDSTGDEHGSRPCPRCGASGRGERGAARPVGGVGVVDVEPGAGKEGGSSAEVTLAVRDVNAGNTVAADIIAAGVGDAVCHQLHGALRPFSGDA